MERISKMFANGDGLESVCKISSRSATHARPASYRGKATAWSRKKDKRPHQLM